jgi:hypothetical protein
MQSRRSAAGKEDGDDHAIADAGRTRDALSAYQPIDERQDHPPDQVQSSFGFAGSTGWILSANFEPSRAGP